MCITLHYRAQVFHANEVCGHFLISCTNWELLSPLHNPPTGGSLIAKCPWLFIPFRSTNSYFPRCEDVSRNEMYSLYDPLQECCEHGKWTAGFRQKWGRSLPFKRLLTPYADRHSIKLDFFFFYYFATMTIDPLRSYSKLFCPSFLRSFQQMITRIQFSSGDSPVSEFYVPTFRNAQSVSSS